MKPHRIAYICADPDVPAFGRNGGAVCVQGLVRAMVRQGAEVELFVARFGGGVPEDLCNLVTHLLPCPRDGDLVDREHICRHANVVLYEKLQAAGPFDLVYERHSPWNYAGMAWARTNDVPGLLEVNAPEGNGPTGQVGLGEPVAANGSIRKLLDDASMLIATSEEAGDYLRKQGVSADAVRVVPSRIQPHPFSKTLKPTWIWPGNQPTFTVGFVGGLAPWHGVRVLAEAFARLHQQHPDTRLLFVGDGSEHGVLRQRLRELHLDAAAGFAGGVVPKDVPGLIASMDVAIAPYSPLADFYFSPLKAFEYMVASQPTTESRFRQSSALLRHDEKGLLCEPDDAEILASQLGRLRANAALRFRVSEAARKTILDGYSWDHVAMRILRLAEALVSVRKLANFSLA